MVQNQALASLIDQRLCSWTAKHAFRLGQLLFEQHHRAEDDADKLEKGFDYDFHA